MTQIHPGGVAFGRLHLGPNLGPWVLFPDTPCMLYKYIYIYAYIDP